MKKLTKTLAILIIATLLAATLASSGAALTGIPTDDLYWKKHDLNQAAQRELKSATATNKADKIRESSAKVAESGEEVLSYWFNGMAPDQCAKEWSKDVPAHAYEINDVWWVCDSVYKAYESMDQSYIPKALRIYKIALAFVDLYKELPQADQGDCEYFRRLYQSKIDVYEVSIDLYAEIDAKDGKGDRSFKGAKHEPEYGLYYGELCGEGAIVDFAKKRSSTIIYVQYEDEDMASRVEHDLHINEGLGENRGDYSVIEIAWNFKNEGNSMAQVLKDNEKILKAAEYLNSLGLPVLLRVGAEMNIWTFPAKPEEFKAAFKSIARIMHKNAPNVAIVWSVNAASAQGRTYDMYYPEKEENEKFEDEEFVDWVGISLYTSKYFNCDSRTTDGTAAIWGTGVYANPVRHIRNLVDKYGSKHPIMISEGGVTLKNRDPMLNDKIDDLTDWALPWIQRTYTYIPMIFPEVKAMYWFNKNDLKYFYEFSNNQRVNQRVKNLYGQLTSSGYFLGRGDTDPKITYKKIDKELPPIDSVTLLTYAPYFAYDNVSVEYLIDGAVVGQRDEAPYRFVMDHAKLPEGSHTLGVRVTTRTESGVTELNKREYYLLKGKDSVIISNSKIDSSKVFLTAGGEETPKVETPPKKIPVDAKPSAWYIYVDDNPVSVEAYSIGGANFLKLRDMAVALNGTAKQFEVGYDKETKIVTLTSGEPYATPDGSEGGTATSVRPAYHGGDPLIKDGVQIEVNAYKINNNNYYGLRAMMIILDVWVDYDVTTRIVKIDTSQPYVDEHILHPELANPAEANTGEANTGDMNPGGQQ